MHRSLARRLLFWNTLVLISFILASGVVQAFENNAYPKSFTILERKGYIVCYDQRSKVPLWVYERLTKESLHKMADRHNFSFQKDPEIPQLHRSTFLDYMRSGFDRGHLSAAAHHSDSEETLRETFYLTNVCPQHPSVNRGIWKTLENRISSLVAQDNIVYAYTGPLFVPETFSDGNRYMHYRVIGSGDVAVPTHLFKILLIETSEGETKAESYVIPNHLIEDGTSLEDFRETIEFIERRSGILFLLAHPNLKDPSDDNY